MRIGLNLLFLNRDIRRGTYTYAVRLVNSLLAVDPLAKYFAFVSLDAKDLPIAKASNLRYIISPFRSRNRFIRYIWEQLIFPIQLRTWRVDVLHSLGYVGPVFAPCRKVVTIHDANFIRARTSMGFVKRHALAHIVRSAARMSDHIITVSEFSKAELLRLWRIDSRKVTVTHEGPGWIGGSRPSSERGLVRKTYSLPTCYLAAFGRPNPHKNIHCLVEAFDRISCNFPHDLVLIGHEKSEMEERTQWLLSKLGNRIRMLGHIPSDHIEPILSGADLFVMPSMYEGFGIPVLEAQLSGVPVVCSTGGSLPEVAGDGAMYFDPYSTDDLSAKLSQCLASPRLRKELRQKGFRNARRFSWNNTARDTLELYKQLGEPKKAD